MSDEPKDVRLPVMVSRSEAAAIDNWRFENRMATRADAIRALIRRGLAGQAVSQRESSRSIGAKANHSIGPNTQ